MPKHPTLIPAPTSLFRGRTGRATLAVVVLAALLGAALLTPRLGNSRIAIGLDTDVQFSTAPELIWGDEGGQRESLEAVPGAFSAVQPVLDLIPTSEKNPESAGHDIWIGQHPRAERGHSTPLRKRFHPFDLGQRFLWYQINEGEEGTTYRWERNADTPTLIFLKTPSSGMVRFRTPTGESIVDLYSPEETVVVVDEAELKAARYYASMPRHALDSLRLALPEDQPATIHRLYIGTLVPRIFFSGDHAYPKDGASPRLGETVVRWRPATVDGAIPLSLAPLEQGGRWTFAALFIVIGVLLACLVLGLAVVLWLLRRMVTDTGDTGPVLAPFDARRFLTFFAAFCVVYLFYLGCAYPAIMTNDSVAQWEQAHTWDLTDDHPALHTLAIKLIASGWDNPAAVALVQVFSMSLVLAWAFSLLLRAGAPPWLVGILFHIALLSPKNGILSVTLWKDVPFAILVLLLSILLFRLCYRRQGRMDFLYWIATGVALGLLPLIRHNGLVILLGIAPLLPLLFWRWRVRAFLLGTVLALALFGTVKFGVYRALDVRGWDGLNSYLYTVKTAILIDQDVPLSAEEYTFLDSVRPIGEDRWAFDPHTGNTTANDQYDVAFALENEGRYGDVFKSLTRRYPLHMIQDHLERSHYVYAPAHPEGRKKFGEHYLSRPENQWHIRQAGYPTESLFPEYGRVLGDLILVLHQGSCILLRPALDLYLVLLSLLVLALRGGAPRALVAYLPALLSTFSVLLVPVATQMRYQFPLTLTAAFLIGLALLPRRSGTSSARNDDDTTPTP